MKPHAESDTSIKPFYTASGAVSLSTNGAGSNEGAVSRDIDKPRGATVRAAFLLAAGAGTSGYTPQDGDITINRSPVDLDESTIVPNSIGAGNIRGDVTSIVAPIIDAAPAGPVAVSLDEVNNTTLLDGEVLAVVFDDPNVGSDNSVSLLYGAQQTSGDTFNILLSKPVDRSNPNFALSMALGISFSNQPAGQFSEVNVNGRRLTTSAGGEDDGEAANGALLTVGGVGDSTANPPDPNADDLQCTDPPAPRCDDELYDLKPFVADGDTRIAVDTVNPSNDDNIFFSSLEFRGTSAVVGEGIVLSPSTDSQPVGGTHTSTATVQDSAGRPVPRKTVDFRVTDGPNAGLSGTGVTNADGVASFTYSSELVGTDTVVASFVDDSDTTQTSNSTSVTWTSESGGRPTAVDDAYSTDEDTTLTVPASRGVLANDTNDTDSPLSAVLSAAPSHGALTLRPNGSFRYTPAANVNGTDSFSYVASDGTNSSEPATVTIEVRPVPDGVQALDDSYSATQDQTLLVSDPVRGVLGNDLNVDGGTLRASLLSKPTHGDLVFKQDGTFRYTPDGRESDSFTYRARNPQGEISNIATVRIDVTALNHPPVGVPDSYTTSEDTPLSTGPETGSPSVLANDTDPDGDSLTAGLASGPSHGTIDFQPNGNFVYVPDPDFNGTDTFFYDAFDGSASSGPTRVDIVVAPVNDRPVANSDSYTATQDTTLRVAAPGVLGNDTDVDGDTLASHVLTAPTDGTLTLSRDGSFHYTPRAGFVGTDAFSYVASDHAGMEDSLSSAPAVVAITVLPPPVPPMAASDRYRTPKSTTLRIDRPGVLGNDVGQVGDALSAVLVSGPSHGSLQLGRAGRIVYVPERDFVGIDTFRYRAIDGPLASAPVLVTITVFGAPTPPVSTPPTTPPVSSPPTIAVPTPSTGPTGPAGVPPAAEPIAAPSGEPTAPGTQTPPSPAPTTAPPASPLPSLPPVVVRVPNGLKLSSPSVNPGGSVGVAGSGCRAGSSVTLTVDGRRAGRGTADDKGNFDVALRTPQLEIGKHTVVATCGNRQLSAPVAFVSVTGTSSAPTARALTVGSVFAFFLLFLGLALRRPSSRK